MQDHKLQVFCSVIELESFSRAAEARHLTQSAISHLIKALEKDLGTPLLYRHSRSVKPTPAGIVFYQHAKKILSGYRRLTEDIREMLNTVQGPLHIGADATAAVYLLPQLIYQFKLAYDKVIIHVSVMNPDDMRQRLYNAEIDFVITQETLKEKIFFTEILAEDEMVLIASENNVLAQKIDILQEELLQQSYILVCTGGENSGFWDVFFSNIGIDPCCLNITMMTESQNFAIKMVKYGIGLSIVSRWAVSRDVRQGAVVILNASSQKIRREFKMLRIEKIPLTAAARTFLEFTRHFSFFAPE